MKKSMLVATAVISMNFQNNTYCQMSSQFFISFAEPFTCPLGFTKIGYGCYMVDIQFGSFVAKLASCKTRGGYMIKIDNVEENLQVKNFIEGQYFCPIHTQKLHTYTVPFKIHGTPQRFDVEAAVK